MKKYLVFALIPFLYACSSNNNDEVTYNDAFAKDTVGLDILAGQFSHNIDRKWGLNELLVASRKDYVKYTDQYNTRSHISFDEGKITIETLGKYPARLKNSIVHTLMMGSDAIGIDSFADGDVPISAKPFLEGQVVDQYGKDIKTAAQAEKYANYLIAKKLKTRRLSNGHLVEYVVIPMTANHVTVRAKKYVPLVRNAARHYDINESLILAIMQTESSFNPYAVSYANAIGLMQVVPRTAGRDVFKLVKNRDGEPTKSYLFDPKKNIDAGVAYLNILKTSYLNGINDPASKRYAMISAYNSGAGAVLRVFDNNSNKAIDKINSLLPAQVYRILTTRHPSEQARNYLKKVDRYQKQYRVLAN